MTEARSHKIGILTGLIMEADLLRTRGQDPSHYSIACANADPVVANRELQQIAAKGVDGFLSFGIAGSLSATAKSGDLLLASRVVLPDGRTVMCDMPWRQAVHEELTQLDVSILDGVIAGSNAAITSAQAKRDLAQSTQALAVDMESHIAADIAEERRRPLLVIRAIADSFDQALPKAAMAASGQTSFLGQLGAVLPALMKSPGELPDLIRLGRQTHRAMAVLKKAASIDFTGRR